MPSSWMWLHVALVKNQRFEKNIAFIIRVLQLLVTANVAPSSVIFITVMMEAIRLHISEDGILHYIFCWHNAENSCVNVGSIYSYQYDLIVNKYAIERILEEVGMSHFNVVSRHVSEGQRRNTEIL
jgi:hypothetical protein